jgi:hypothetical protein
VGVGWLVHEGCAGWGWYSELIGEGLSGGGVEGRVALQGACGGRGLFSYNFFRSCVFVYVYMLVCKFMCMCICGCACVRGCVCMHVYLFPWVLFSWSVRGCLHLHTYYVAKVGKRA